MEHKGALYQEGSIGPFHFYPHFSLTLFNPEGNRGKTRKGIKFWIEKLIINSSEELSFRTYFTTTGPEDKNLIP